MGDDVTGRGFSFQQEIMVGSMYQAETPSGLCKYKDNEKGKDLHVRSARVRQYMTWSVKNLLKDQVTPNPEP